MPVDENMGFTNPTPSVTTGPPYAVQISAALTTIGGHRHTGAPDDGLAIPVAGRLYDEDLPLAGVAVTDARAVAFRDAADAVADVASLSVRTSTGDLYYRTLAGTLIRLTAGTVVNTTGDNIVWEYLAVSGDHTITNTDTEVFFAIDTTVAREITLPTAGSVSAGRRYVFADATGDASANAITLTPSGGDTIDGQAEHLIMSPYGRTVLVSNGSDGWLAFDAWNSDALLIKTATFIAIESTTGDVSIVADAGSTLVGSAAATLELSDVGAVSLAGAAALSLSGGTTAELVTSAGQLTLTSTGGGIALTATGDGADITLTATGDDITMAAATVQATTSGAQTYAASGALAASGTTATLEATAGQMTLTASADIVLTATGDDVIVGSATVQATTTGAQTFDAAGAITVSADGVATLESTAANVAITAGGAGNIVLTATGDDITATGDVFDVEAGTRVQLSQNSGDVVVKLEDAELTFIASKFGAFNAPAVAKPTVTGSRGGNAALASLLTALANLGWITDGTSA